LQPQRPPDAGDAVVYWRWSLDHGRAATASTSWPTGRWRLRSHNLGYDDDAAAQVPSSSSFCELTL
jgi:hypothetical protein